MKTLCSLRLFGKELACNAIGDDTTGAITGISFDEIMASLTTLTPEEKQKLIEALSINLGQQEMLASSRQDTNRQFTHSIAKALGVPPTTPQPRLLAHVNSLLRAGGNAQLTLIEQECEKMAGPKTIRAFDGSIRNENNAYKYLFNHIDHDDLTTAKKQIDMIVKGDKIFKQLLSDVTSSTPGGLNPTKLIQNSNSFQYANRAPSVMVL